MSTRPELFTVILTVGHSMLPHNVVRREGRVWMGAEQRRVVVVGAGSGIGAATAAHFHSRGDFVLAVDVRPHRTPASRYIRCDLRDAASIKELLDQISRDQTHACRAPVTSADVSYCNTYSSIM